MEEKNEEKINKEDLKIEASNAVNQVKDTIKKVDIKKDTLETKGLILEMVKDPLGKIKQIANSKNTKFLVHAIILLVIWTVAELIYKCFSLSSLWGYSHLGASVLGIITSTITPVLMILVMTFVIFFMNRKNKKSLTNIFTTVVIVNIPVIVASIVSILTLINTQIAIITIPFAKLCFIITTILMYFATKTIFGVEKSSEFIKKFIIIQGAYYIVYIILSLLGIHI